MHELVECGLATEVHGTQSISYVLEDESLFNLSEYKIIHNKEATEFVESAKSKCNGKIKLTYFVDGYVSLKSLAPVMESYPFISVLANILESVLTVMGNGYLDACDLILDINRIYVNPNLLDVKLIYLPVNKCPNSGTSVLKSSPLEDLRSNLIQLISSTPNIISARTKEIRGWLADSSRTLESICAGIRMEKPNTQVHGSSPKKTTMYIRSLNAAGNIEFKIDGKVFSLGRKADEVDGWVNFNPAISGVHCMIYKTATGFEVEDTSRNGTFINKIKLQPGLRTAIKNGDTLRLANSDFSVNIVEG